MLKRTLVIAFFFCMGIVNNVLAAGIAPQVVLDPYDTSGNNQVVKLQVTTSGDQSWMYIPASLLPGVNDHAAHPTVTVSFDIARPYDAQSEYLTWGWVDLYADSLDDIVPAYGGQIQWNLSSERLTMPVYAADANGNYTYNYAATVFAQVPGQEYARLELTWDFANGKIITKYDGSIIDNNADMVNPGSGLHGFMIQLSHISGYAEDDYAYIDNFSVTGSDIYNSIGFEDFNPGNLNDQGGWIGGNENTSVPEPATLLLLGLGLLGIIPVRKKMK